MSTMEDQLFMADFLRVPLSDIAKLNRAELGRLEAVEFRQEDLDSMNAYSDEVISWDDGCRIQVYAEYEEIVVSLDFGIHRTT